MHRARRPRGSRAAAAAGRAPATRRRRRRRGALDRRPVADHRARADLHARVRDDHRALAHRAPAADAHRARDRVDPGVRAEAHAGPRITRAPGATRTRAPRATRTSRAARRRPRERARIPSSLHHVKHAALRCSRIERFAPHPGASAKPRTSRSTASSTAPPSPRWKGAWTPSCTTATVPSSSISATCASWTPSGLRLAVRLEARAQLHGVELSLLEGPARWSACSS